MNLFRSCIALALVLFLGGFGLTACDQGDVPTFDPGTEVPSPAPIEDDPIELPEPIDQDDAVEDEEVALVDTEVEEEVLWDSGLLVNGSFEEWDNGRPAGWRMSSGGGVRTTNAHEGDFALMIPDAGENNWPMVSQTFDVEELNLLGKTINYGATFVAHEADKVVVQIRYRVDGNTVRSSINHPGDGEWNALYKNTTLPDEIDDNEIEFSLFRRPNTEGEAIFDNVRLEIVD